MMEESDSPLVGNSITTHNIPTYYWELLSSDDKREYMSLRDSFHNQHYSSTKERHSPSFQSDLTKIIKYIQRRSELQETRSIVSGVFFAPTFVCVNTRQLKYLIGRCKSSINNGFQQLGYMSTKTKIRQCILSALPSLLHDQSILRQWTMRCCEHHQNGSLSNHLNTRYLTNVVPNMGIPHRMIPPLSNAKPIPNIPKPPPPGIPKIPKRSTPLPTPQINPLVNQPQNPEDSSYHTSSESSSYNNNSLSIPRPLSTPALFNDFSYEQNQANMIYQNDTQTDEPDFSIDLKSDDEPGWNSFLVL